MYREVRFYLANGLTQNLVKNARYVVYGHECVDGLYIGYSIDPARRWEKHVKSAFEETDQNHNNCFKKKRSEPIRRGLNISS